MEIKCPHCHNSNQVPDGAVDVVCSSCGSSICVEHDRTHTYSEQLRRLGKFELVERVGRGAFGVVWKARDTELGRFVAVKIPHADRLGSDHDSKRFLREARTTGQLRHPGIVTVHDVAHHDGTTYLVCDFVSGVTLSELLTARRLTPREAADVIAQVAEALDYAHSMGVVHRDIKPSNVMLELPALRPVGESAVPLGKPMLMDFGLALGIEAEATMTADGQVLGTPAYMSPEQAAGQSHQVDARSDVYSLGVVLYQLLVGELPFRGQSRMLIEQVLREEPRPPRKLDARVPRDLETICLKAMAKEPARRYATARAMADDLRRFERGEPILARPAGGAERLWRWSRRNPKVAGLTAALAAVLIGVAAGAVGVAVQFKRLAGLERDQRRRAESLADDNRRSVYVAHTNLAQQAREAGDVLRGLELLDELRPGPREDDLRGFEWYCLWRQFHGERLTLFRQGGPVRCVAFSHDGRTLATAWGQGVRLWDSDNGRARLGMHPRFDEARCVAFAPGDKLLAIGGGPVGGKGQLTLWDIENNRALVTAELDDPVMSLAFSPDGATLATGTAHLDHGYGNPMTRLFWIAPGAKSAEARLWHVDGLKPSTTFKGQSGGILSVAFSADGRSLAAGGWDRTLKLWDVGTGDLKTSLDQNSQVWCVGFSSDGKHMAYGGGKWDGEAMLTLCDASTLQRRGSATAGHQAGITSLAFSPDGRTLATSSWDRTVKLWDVATGAVRSSLTGHTSYVSSVVFSPDGSRLASGSWDRTAKLWYADERLDETSLSGWEIGGGYCAEFSPDGKLLATSGSSTVKVLDLTSGQVVAVLPAHEGQTLVAFSPDGRLLATAGMAGTEGGARLFDTGSWNARRDLDEKDNVWSLAFSPDGAVLATGSADGTAKLWDVRTAKRLKTFQGESGTVRFVSFSPDGTRLAAAVHLGTTGASVVKIWSVDRGEQLAALKGHSGNIEAVSFTPDGSTLVTCSHDTTARLWDVATWKVRATLKGHLEVLYHQAVSPDGKTLATAGWDGTVKLWSIADGRLLASLPGVTGVVWHVAFSRDGQTLAAAGGYSEGGATSFRQTAGVRLWHTATAGEVQWQRRVANALSGEHSGARLDGHAAGVCALAISPDGKLCASGDRAGTIMLWNLASKEELATFRDHAKEVWALDFSPDGTRLASASWDGTVKLWDMTRRRLLASLNGHRDAVYAVAFAPDGRLLATGGLDSTVILWDAAARRRLAVLAGHGGTVSALAFSADGRLLASSSWDHTVKLWDVSRRAQTATLGGHDWGVTSLALTPDGQTVAGGGGFGDPRIRLWDAATGRQRAVLQGHADEISDMAITPDGRTLISTSWDGTITCWDPRSGRERFTIHANEVLCCLALSRDGKLLATGGDGKSIKLWQMEFLEQYGIPLLAPAEPRVRRLTDPESLYERRQWQRLAEVGPKIESSFGDKTRLSQYMGEAYFQLGDYRRALEACQQHLALHSQCAWGVQRAAACHEELEQHAEAAQLLERLIQLEPSNADPYNQLAWLYAAGPQSLRNPAKAVPLAQKAVELAPANASYLNTLGVAQYRSGDFQAAIGTLDRAASANSQGATAFDLFYLAMSYHQLGKPDQAREHHDRASTLTREQPPSSKRTAEELDALAAESAAVLMNPTLDPKKNVESPVP